MAINDPDTITMSCGHTMTMMVYSRHRYNTYRKIAERCAEIAQGICNHCLATMRCEEREAQHAAVTTYMLDNGYPLPDITGDDDGLAVGYRLDLLHQIITYTEMCANERDKRDALIRFGIAHTDGAWWRRTRAYWQSHNVSYAAAYAYQAQRDAGWSHDAIKAMAVLTA